MDKKKTKLVKYRDDEGKLRQSILPIDAPDDEVALGIPLALLFPVEWEPFRDRLEAALAARGITDINDLHNPGADEQIRRAFQQIIRFDIVTLKQLNPKV